jgi:hypothetical protein
MLRTTCVLIALALLPMAAPAEAQGRDRNAVARAQGIPPGHLPPANLCRVWYDNRAPGRQPGPTNCDRAEAIASRDRHARVIYGVNQFRYGAYGRDDRAVYRVPGRTRAPDVYRGYPRGVSRDTAFQNGYRDGLEKGRDDGRDNDRYDPRGERWYRSADRGYVKSYGSKDRYKDLYRDGFLAGYADGYREGQYRRR